MNKGIDEFKKFLTSKEKVIEIFSIGDNFFKLYFYWGVFLSIISFGLLLLPFLFLYFYYRFYFKRSYLYALTDKRIIALIGFVNKKVISVDYKNITDLNIKQNLFERWLKIGNIYVNTAGSTEKELILKNIQHPEEVVRKINEFKYS